MNKYTISHTQFKNILNNSENQEFIVSAPILKLLSNLNFSNFMDVYQGITQDKLKSDFLMPILKFISLDFSNFEKLNSQTIYAEFVKHVYEEYPSALLSRFLMKTHDSDKQNMNVQQNFFWALKELQKSKDILTLDTNFQNELQLLTAIRNNEPLNVIENEHGLSFKDEPVKIAAAQYQAHIPIITEYPQEDLDVALPTLKETLVIPINMFTQETNPDEVIKFLVGKKSPSALHYFKEHEDEISSQTKLEILKKIPTQFTLNYKDSAELFSAIVSKTDILEKVQYLDYYSIDSKLSVTLEALNPLQSIFRDELKALGNEYDASFNLETTPRHFTTYNLLLQVIKQLNESPKLKELFSIINNTEKDNHKDNEDIYENITSHALFLSLIPVFSNEHKKNLTPTLIDIFTKRKDPKKKSFDTIVPLKNDEILNILQTLPYLESFNDEKISLGEFTKTICFIDSLSDNLPYDYIFRHNRQIPQMLFKVLKSLEISSIHNPLIDRKNVLADLDNFLTKCPIHKPAFFNMLSHFIENEEKSALSRIHDLNSDFVSLFKKKNQVKLYEKLDDAGPQYFHIQMLLKETISHNVKLQPDLYQDSYKQLGTMTHLLNKYPAPIGNLLSIEQDELIPGGKIDLPIIEKLLHSKPSYLFKLREDVRNSPEVKSIVLSSQFFNAVSDDDYPVKDLTTIYSKNDGEFLYEQFKNPNYYHGTTFCTLHPELLTLLPEEYTEKAEFWISLIDDEIDFFGSKNMANFQSDVFQHIPPHILRSTEFFNLAMKEFSPSTLQFFPIEMFENFEHATAFLGCLKDVDNPLRVILLKLPEIDKLITTLTASESNQSIPHLLDKASILLNQSFLEKATPVQTSKPTKALKF